MERRRGRDGNGRGIVGMTRRGEEIGGHGGFVNDGCGNRDSLRVTILESRNMTFLSIKFTTLSSLREAGFFLAIWES